MVFEDELKEAITNATGLKKKDIEIKKPFGTAGKFGDYCFACFSLAKKKKKDPKILAEKITDKIKKLKIKEIEKVEAVGGYVNFFLNKEVLAENILTLVLKGKEKFGGDKKKKKTILVEFPAPNTNKPLHIGHLRNAFIGTAVSNILEFLGYNVKRIDLINDRGIHICQTMLAYEKWGRGKLPGKIKGDHFIGDFYVLYNKKEKQNPKLKEECQKLLKKWEENDRKTITLWKKMNNWYYKGMNETYKILGIKHDKVYFESNTYKKGKEIVLEGLKKGIFYKKENGAVAINLGKDLGEKILLRSNDTTVYITQDLFLAWTRYKDFKFDKMIYVVASEQNYHFKVLFTILKLLGYKWANNCYHLNYGMVNLPSGKMKSREGIVIDADDLIDEIREDAKKELKRRYKLKTKELEKRALAIGLSALRFSLLKVDTKKDFLFDKKEALDFEGFSGPYLQYSLARASSILKKAKNKIKKKGKRKPVFKNLTQEEVKLIKKISDFPQVIKKSAKELKPDLVALYTYELAQLFSSFYHSCPVIQAKKGIKERRLLIVKAVKQVMTNALNLLGIEALETM